MGVVFNLGMSEIVVILVVALVFLGPKKLPELASGLGKMIRELRKATADIKNEIELDETIRKPVEELREAMTLHPEELKRRDLERAARTAREKAEREEEVKRQAAEAAAKIPEAAVPAPPIPVVPPPPIAPPAARSSASMPALPNSDKTVAMPPPSFGHEAAGAGVPIAKVAGTVSRPTLIGIPPGPTAPGAPAPRPAPPLPPAAAKLPPPSGAARAVPSPPVKKD
jgi:sec-independent protein translocase protein TatB